MEKAGPVSALLLRPKATRCLLVFGHGSGAGMRHPFMLATADLLAVGGIATFRYQFPFIGKGKSNPDSRTTLIEKICSAVEPATKMARGLPVLTGELLRSLQPTAGFHKSKDSSSSAFYCTRQAGLRAIAARTWPT